jgi:carbamoyltransferase
MGLAPYGEPKYVRQILDHVVNLRPDGSLQLNQEYFNYLGGLTMTNGVFDRLFEGPARVPETPLVQKHLDLARSVQEVCEEAMLRMARTAHAVTGKRALCMAGGVALNCVGNGRILREGPFEKIWIQPASGDAGGALGVAQLIWHRQLKSPRPSVATDGMRGAYLGPEFTPDEIKAYLDSVGAVCHRLDPDALIERTAELLVDGKVIGWFVGRMEFGPRALGGRSILGDARNPVMQSQMNIKIKFREGFRPFAPSVLREKVAEWFELDVDSPYMLLVAPVRKDRRRAVTEEEESRWGIEKLKVQRSEIPAVTHVDYSARIQTVSRADNASYYDLIRAFERRTGCPVLVNTSFNVRGEPIVCTPADAYRCFMRTNIDHLVLWPYLLSKTEQPAWREEGDWRTEVPLD